MTESSESPTTDCQGKVYLVGAGPGDPGMLTLRGKECLQRADVVLYDYLVNPAILRHVKEGAEQIVMGSHAQGKVWPQARINEEMVTRAGNGQSVVRLKGGDPAVFARGAEEVEFLASHQIPFEIVPGITAALAAGSCAGTPITHREFASAVALVTGHERAGQGTSKLDYDALARFPGTLVFYMGTTTVREWSHGLLKAGMASDTPVTFIRRCSFPDQTREHCQLDELADRIETPTRTRPPVIFVIGDVARLPQDFNWFEQRPLFGRKCWVTRPLAQAAETESMLTELGADVECVPAIKIIDRAGSPDIRPIYEQLDTFDWIVFSSANGVRCFSNQLERLGYDARRFGQARIAAIGPATADLLRDNRIQPDLVPEQFEADTFAKALSVDSNGKRFLLVRASRGREILHDTLASQGADVTQAVFYESIDDDTVNDTWLHQLDAGQVDWVTVSSSAIAKSLFAKFGQRLSQTKLASISPITTATLKECGLVATSEAKTYTMRGLVDAILAYERKLSG